MYKLKIICFVFLTLLILKYFSFQVSAQDRSFNIRANYIKNRSNEIEEELDEFSKNNSSILSPIKNKANKSLKLLELKPVKMSSKLNLSKYSHYQGVFSGNISPDKSRLNNSLSDSSEGKEPLRSNFKNIEIGNLTRFENKTIKGSEDSRENI